MQAASSLKIALLLAALLGVMRAEARRVVIIKVDGLGQQVLDRFLHEQDRRTGKSALPWIQNVFVERGAVLNNFYVRGISLSVPSWSMLDSGYSAVIRGNAEFDRASGRVYDYLNFFPFYFLNARNARADMPGVEVLDDAGIPLLIDSFPAGQRVQGMQLFQRGVRWQTLRAMLPRRFGRRVGELFNEWQTGFELFEALGEQVESDLVAALARDNVFYLDYFFGDYDHVAHLANDEASQRRVLQKLDALTGRIWRAIERSPLAKETLLVLVSDHGMNTDPAIYSQGFNLVDFLGSAGAGGHHVMTNRHPESEYKLKGLDPFVSEVITPSRESLYLPGEANDYPTALLDLDGNERAALYLRNSDLNAVHLLMKLTPRKLTAERLLPIVEKHRAAWSRTAAELDEELAALQRAIERHRAGLPAKRSKKMPDEEKRQRAEIEAWDRNARQYGEYRRWLATMLKITAEDLLDGKIKTEAVAPRRAMMDSNSVYQLQNFVVNGNTEGAFSRVNYFELLTGIRARNTQTGVDNRPVDFVAVRVPAGAIGAALSEDERPDSDAVWLYASGEKQALILPRRGAGSLRYLPVKRLKQDAGGRITFERQAVDRDYPLRYFEDPALEVAGDRAAWLEGWHTEAEWLRAIHRARYSNGIIGLAQQFAPIELGPSAALWEKAGAEEAALKRFAVRLREMVRPDMLIVANDHWNFNVRGYNPGGNHGSFLQASTHSVLMLAGAGIPPGKAIETPYDSLSFVPTLQALLGHAGAYEGTPITELVPVGRAVTEARRPWDGHR